MGILDRNLRPQQPRSKYKRIYVQPKNNFLISMLANKVKHEEPVLPKCKGDIKW